MYDILAMAGDQAAAASQENLLWDINHEPWNIISNDATFGVAVGDGGGDGDEEKKGKRVMVESSTCNSPNNDQIMMAPGGGDVAAEAVGEKKKSGGVSSKNGRKAGGGGGGGEKAGGESDHEIHIWTERERRKKMRNMFSSLHALLPQLPPKADKSTIVDEAVNYIKTLQQTLQKLQKQKLERLHGVSTANNFVVDPLKLVTQQTLSMDHTRESFLADQGSSSNMMGAANIAATTNPSPSFSNIPQLPTIFHSWTSPNVTLNVCGEDAHFSVCSLKKPGLFTAICFVLDKHKLEVVCAHVSSDDTRSMYMIQTHASGQVFPPMEETYKQAAAEILLWVNS